MDYRALSSENHEIRLLTLLGGKTSALVSCELNHYSLIDPPPYTALSYCWGNPYITKTLIVNGVRVQATVGLEAALRQLHADGYSKLWVDALCINQDDREERSLQVLRMMTIYSRASAVVSWLGIETDNSNKTIAYIDYLNANCPTESDYIPDSFLGRASFAANNAADVGFDAQSAFRSEETSNRQRSPDEQNSTRSMEDLARGFDIVTQDAFNALLRRDYWKRLWIIQEVVAAGRIKVYCGHCSTTMENIENVLKGTAEGRCLLVKGDVPYFKAFRKSPTTGRSTHLVRMLLSSKASLATDPRDRVYALLGLAANGKELVPLPNYRQPVDCVYKDMTRAIFEQEGRPNILLLRTAERAPTERLPSWVPDWQELPLITRPWIHNVLLDTDHQDDLRVGLKQFLSTFSTRMKTFTRPPVTFYNEILEMKGVLYDTIDGISTQFYCGEAPSDLERKRRHMIQPSKERNYYGSDDSLAEAIADTVCLHECNFGDDTLFKKNSSSNLLIFNELLTPRGEAALHSHPHLEKWLADNATFLLDGLRLSKWMKPKVPELCVPKENGDRSRANSPRPTTPRPSEENELQSFIGRFGKAVGCGMRLVTTREGRVGMVHPQARQGDLIVTLCGGGMPIVLRKVRASEWRHRGNEEMNGRGGCFGDAYAVVGEAYLHPMKDFTPTLGVWPKKEEVMEFYIV